MQKNKPVKQIEKEYNAVINTVDHWLHSLDQFVNYDILAVVNGILYAVFKMVYTIAPNDESAKEVIESALYHYESERNKRPEVEA
tara:strand:- start:120 stop:374 length:255 start_codon:yes stop_codon:yes gene_type:complete